MRMFAIILILMAFSIKAKAPNVGWWYIPSPEKIMPYESIIRAVTLIESGNGKYLLNEKEMAVGWFGIRSIRLDDYNLKAKDNITHQECYQYKVGRKIFLWYASQIDYRDIKAICINWNGKSIYNKYYTKVKAIL